MMKQLWMILLMLFLTGLSMIGVQAQTAPSLICGDILSGQFSADDLEHNYDVDLPVGTIAIIHSLPLDTPLELTTELTNAGGALVGTNEFAPPESDAVVETSEILASGVYYIRVTGDQAGSYQLFISCVDQSGDIITNNNMVQGGSCGDQFDNTMLRPDELHRYFLYLEEGTEMDIFLEALYGQFADMTFELGLYSPDNQELDRINDMFKDIERTIQSQTVTTTGLYRLYVRGFDGSGENYRLSIDCTLPDGSLALSGGNTRRVIEPTQLSAPEALPETDNDDSITDESPQDVIDDITNQTTLTSVTPVDLIDDLPNTGQLTADSSMIAYQFSGLADEAITLVFDRIRGGSDLEIWVMTDDGDTIFSSLLYRASALSVDLTLPQDGDYLIYLALLDVLPEESAVFTVEVIVGDT